MALDVAEFLWNKFVNSLQQADSELSGTMSVFKSSIKDLVSEFKSIKDVVDVRDVMRERDTYSKTIGLLYQLNDEFAEWRIFAHECNGLNNKLSILNFPRHTFIKNMKSRLAEIRSKFEQLATPEEESRGGIIPGITVTGPTLSAAEVFGFDKQSQKIEDMLLEKDKQSQEIEDMLLPEKDSSSGGLRAIGVVGIAGVGKTTLVQKLLESGKVKKNFDPILWLPFSGMMAEGEQVSRDNFMTHIVNHLGNKVEESIVGLEKLMKRLNQLLSGKSYLIVLDDVCHQHVNIEERLCRALPNRSGCAVIVTSRLKEVVQKVVQPNHLIHVEPLNRNDCWSIFMNTSTKVDYTNEEEIKDQCHGLQWLLRRLLNFHKDRKSLTLYSCGQVARTANYSHFTVLCVS